jgi:FkbM family methyltransferase
LSYKRALTRSLDRPGARFLLGKLATRYARRATGDDMEIEYAGGMWVHRVGRTYFPDGQTFEYKHGDFGAWKGQLGQYTSDTKDFWLQHYDPQVGDVIVDVGAGRGEDTLTFSRAAGEAGRVIAVEAHPATFEILKSFCELNRLTNVTKLQVALMDKAGIVRIAESESSWMENAIDQGSGTSGIQVRASTLVEVCEQQGLKEIAFLKMNIEGAERQALFGMKPVMSRIRQICVACHDFRSELGHGEQFRTRAFVQQFLIECGFTLASRPDDPRDYVRNHIFGLRHC